MSGEHDADPQPGDFDAELAELDATDVTYVEADPSRQLVVQVAVPADEAATLERLARERGQAPSELAASLIRSASERTA